MSKKRRVIIEMEFDENDKISRERLMEIAGESLYRPDVVLFDEIGNDEHDWETLNDGLKFRFSAFDDAKSFDRYSDFYNAFLIFGKYSDSGFVYAEHDEVYAGPDASVVSDEDKQKLEELGWHVDENNVFYKFV